MASEFRIDSPVIGTGELVARCGETLRPARPAPPRTGETVGVTFSGGGFRATLAGLGVIRYLADAGLLGNLRYASSVSGGSVANGLLAAHWPTLRSAGFTTAAVDELVVEPAVSRISSRSLKLRLLENVWRAVGPRTRTDVLADQLDRWFFAGRLLEGLDPEVRFVLSAANLTTGVRFTFERDVVGDYVTGLAPTAGTGLRLAQAAAASAAVPGAFAPWVVRGVTFPCPQGRPPTLLDGGVYDNTGLEVLDSDRYRAVFTLTMNAGGLLRPGAYGRVPLVRELARANALLYRQSTGLRTRWMVERFERALGLGPDAPLPEGARRGVLVGLSTTFDDAAEGALADWQRAFPPHRSWGGRDLAFVPTVFDRLDVGLCRSLVYRGWWLVGAAIAAYHPGLAPRPATLHPPVHPQEGR